MHVKVGGRWLHSLTPWGDLSWSHDGHGCKEATFKVYRTPGERHPLIYRGAMVEVMLGASSLWTGSLSDLDWMTGAMSAKGYAANAENYPTIDGSGDATSAPATAVDQAIADGWPVTRDASIPLAAYTTEADGSNSTAGLLDDQATELGYRWSVRADRIVRMEADPATPTLQIIPGVVELGLASDDYASTVAVVYKDSSTGVVDYVKRTDTAAAARFGEKFVTVDATVLGPISTARANAIGDGVLARGGARLGWTGSIEVTADELLTMGGVPAALELVRSGLMVRAQGLFDDLQWLGGRTYLDVVIGETAYVAGARTITLSPSGSVADTLSGVIEETVTAAKQAA